MTVLDITADGLSLLSGLTGGPYTLGESASFGAPELSERYVAWCEQHSDEATQKAFPYGEWHTRAVHSLPVLIKSSTLDLDRDALSLALAPGKRITVTTDVGSRYTTIRAVSVSENRKAASIEMGYSVTTDPYWLGPQQLSTTEDAWNTSNAWVLSITCGGDVPALTETRLTWRQASVMQAFGIFPDTPAGYSPIVNLQGTATAGSMGAQTTVAASGNGTYADIATASFDSSDHAGDALAIVRAKLASGSGTVRAAFSAAGGGSLVASPAVVNCPAVSASTSLKEYAFGPLPYPPADLPVSGETATGLGAETTLVSVTTGTSKSLASDEWVLATFTIPANTSISALGFSGTVGTFRLYAWSGTATAGDALHTMLTLGAVHTGLDIRLAAGTYCLRAGGNGATVLRDTAAPSAATTGYRSASSSPFSWAAGDGSDSTVDYGITVKTRPIVTYASGIKVQANGTGQDCAADGVTLMPVKWGAFLSTATLAAGQGVAVDATGKTLGVYRYARDFSTGEEGSAAWATTFEVFGPWPRLLPGVNTVVALIGNSDGTTPSGGRIDVYRQERYISPYEGG